MNGPDVEDRISRIHATRRRSIETLRRMIDTVTDVIDQNRRLAEGTEGDHRQRAQERVREGQRELGVLRTELAALQAEEATHRT